MVRFCKGELFIVKLCKVELPNVMIGLHFPFKWCNINSAYDSLTFFLKARQVSVFYYINNKLTVFVMENDQKKMR
jgi:hypothetical protein